MKFCRDCKWAEGDPSDPYALKCGNEKNGVDYTHANRYAVSGIEEPVIRATLTANCLSMRQQPAHPGLGIELCGPDGIWWKAK